VNLVGPGGLMFLVSSDIEKPDANTREFIRSHVMLGKNRGKKLPSRSSKKPTPSSSESTSSRVLITLPDTPQIFRRFASPSSTIAFADTIEPGELNDVLRRKLL
jgi:hypothetical protein